MASFSKKSIRSISLPSRSHPTTIKVEEELNKLRTLETYTTPDAESICNGLCGLVELYKCMDELLSLPQTIQALSKHQNEKWVDELLEGPLRLLDICAITRDFISQLKENVRELQSSLRRRKGDLSIEANITKYAAFRKKMKKEAKKQIASLKQMDQAIEGSLVVLDVDQHVSALIRVLREANAMSISIFQSVLSFFSASKKPSRWSISRLVNKGLVASEDQKQNELESADTALRSLQCRAEEAQSVQSKLETVETCFQGIEKGLEDSFRCLIKSRTFLLNIFSC